MHGVLEEFLKVLAKFPTLLLHLLLVILQVIGVVVLGIACLELTPLLLGHSNDFGCYRTRQLTALAQDHVPDVVGYHAPALLALLHLDDIHQSQVLDILAEGSNETGITHLGPYVSHLVEEFHEQLVGGQFGLTVLLLPLVQALEVVLQVGHQRTHHATGQTGLNQQGVVDVVLCRNVVTEEVVIHLLNQGTCLHVGLHVDFLHLESGILQHLLHGDDVGMTGTP